MRKPAKWIHDSIKSDVRSWPQIARRKIGRELGKVQRGEQPSHYREMPSIGLGVREIKVIDERNQYRLIYVAKFVEAVYVLHAITRKKTQKTKKNDIELARVRYQALIEQRKGLLR